MSNRNDLVIVKNMELYSETDEAAFIGKPGLMRNKNATHHKTWLPYSLIDSHEFNQVGDIGDLEIPRWLADQKELDYEEA